MPSRHPSQRQGGVSEYDGVALLAATRPFQTPSLRGAACGSSRRRS